MAGVLLALVTAWPLPARLTSHVPEAVYGDPYIQAWQVAWGGHALVTQPDALFQANVFWPEEDSLAFSDALIGYAPAGLLGSGSRAALVRYNLLFLFAYALPFVAAFLLARELGASTAAAVVAGAAFAYAPFRADQATHLHVISSGGIPLALFALLRGYSRRRRGWVFAGWLVATWQIAIGFSLGLQLGYLLLAIAVCYAVVGVRRRATFDRALVLPTLAGAAVLLAFTAWQAAPYLRVAGEHRRAVRTEEELGLYSPPAFAFLAAPEGNRIWGGLTAAPRAALARPTEQSLWPGVVVTALAVAGVVAGSVRRRLRWALAAGTLVTALLALGTSPWFGRYVYGLLFDLAPGWQGVRTPGRLVTLTSLGLALLAALGADAAVRAVRDRRRVTLLAGAAAVVVLEGSAHMSVTPAPDVPAAAVRAPAPQLHLPSDERADRIYTYFSTDGFPEIVNGLGAFTPELLEDVRAGTKSFPDAESVGYLTSLGVTTVVLHPALAADTPWEDAAARPLVGLPVTREDSDGVIVFRLAPP